MSKHKVPRKAPKVLLPLASLTVRQVEDFSGKPLPPLDRETIRTSNVALALDFLERINWRRTEAEQAAWIDREEVADQLHTVRRLMLLGPGVAQRPGSEISEDRWGALMSSLLEYLAIRIELAAETTAPRERRYMVAVDVPALEAMPKQRAVA